MLAVDCQRRLEPLVGMRWRHPHVDDRDIWQVVLDRPRQCLGIGDGRHHVVSPAAKSLGEPVPHDRRVLRDHYPQRGAHQARTGSSTVMVVGPPAGLSTDSRPSTVCTRSTSPASPPPGFSLACPAPSSVTLITSLPLLSLTLISARPAPLCLATLASSSAAQKYAMASMAGDGRLPRSVVSPAGTALASASTASAVGRPRSSTAGWIPLARSRSSASVSLAFRCAAAASETVRSGSAPCSKFSLISPR